MKGERPSLTELFRKEPWLLALLAAGLLLLLWPGSQAKRTENAATETELRLRETLETMDGAGRVQVLLAEKEGRNGGFTGAVVVCDGAGSSAVKLRITRAVSAFTGLGADKIIVEQWKIK